jgi:hypothetical protein
MIVVAQAQKERNVLKHQSTLLMADVIGDGKMMRLLQEVEVLKRTLEEEQQRHMMELQELQVCQNIDLSAPVVFLTYTLAATNRFCGHQRLLCSSPTLWLPLTDFVDILSPHNYMLG